jgi:hypothetical protein
LSNQDHLLTKESTSEQKAESQEGHLTQLKEQVSGIPITKPSPVTTKKLGKPNGLHGGGTARRSLPGSVGHMKIMAKQVTNRVSTIKLPNGQCTQTGTKTLKRFFRVHFPDSMLIDNSNDGHGRQNLDVCKHTTNNGDWNLVRIVIHQSKLHGH